MSSVGKVPFCCFGFPTPSKTSVSDLVLFQNGCVVLVIRKKKQASIQA